MMSQSRGAEVSPYLASYIDVIFNDLSLDQQLRPPSERKNQADETMRALISAGHIDETNPLSKDSALHYAALSPYPEHVKWLIEAGANCKAVTVCGDSPLHVAVSWGRLEAVSMLVEADFDVEQINVEGMTPKNLAQFFGYQHISAFLQAFEARQSILRVAGRVLHETPK